MITGPVIDRNSYSAASEQLFSYFRDQILTRSLRPGQKLPTAREIVDRAGVGSQTVAEAFSALRNEGLVEVTRRGTFVNPNLQLEAEADGEQNSQRNGDVAKGSRSHEMAMLVADISLYQYSQVVAGASDSVDKSSGALRLEILQSHENVDKQSRLLLSILHKKLAGVIMVPPVVELTPAFHVQLLQEHGIPVVFCYRAVEGVQAPLVSWDWKQLGRQAAELLMDHGHERIAYISSWRYSIPQAYEEGLREALGERGLDLPEECVHYNSSPEGTQHPNGGQETRGRIEAMLSSNDRPTAIFSNDTRLETLLLLTAQKLGLRIPEDISLLQYGGRRPDCVMEKSIAQIGFELSDIGHKVVDVLREMIDGNRPINSDEVINMPIVIDRGQTLGPRPS